MLDTKAALKRALDIRSLRIPNSIPVIDIKCEAYTDSDGESALRVWVIFEETSDAGDFSGEDVGELKFAIRESLRNNGIEEFPYISIVSEDERAASDDAD